MKKLRAEKMSVPGIAAAALLFMTVSGLAGDKLAGEVVFKRCAACHATGEGAQNKVGPELNGIIGKTPGTQEEFSFSESLVQFGEGKVWDADLMAAWLKDPKSLVPKNKMTFGGIKDKKDLEDVIAYLSSFDSEGVQQ
jgi:cytochrome c